MQREGWISFPENIETLKLRCISFMNFHLFEKSNEKSDSETNSTKIFMKVECLLYICICYIQIIRFLAAQVLMNSANRRRLKVEDIVPQEYDGLRTPKRTDAPAQVRLTVVIMNVRNVDVSEMSIRFDLLLTNRWQDDRLTFPSEDEERMVLDLEWRQRLWMPDLFFENSIEGHVQDTIIPNMYIWLYRNKTIHFTARVSIEFICQMDLRLFPHDTQECDMLIKSLAHTEDEMELIWDPDQNITQGEHIVLPQFEIIKVTSGYCKKVSDRFSCLKGSVQMTRRSGYYITNVYVPTSLIVFMSMLSFWIPPDAVPARVTLGVTSLLTIVTKQYQASLPNVSYIVALNIWLSACIGFVFVSLLEYATVIALHTRLKKAKGMSDQVRIVHKVYPREIRAVQNGWSSKKKKKRTFWHKNFTPDNIDYVSRILFPCVFIGQCSIYWAIYYT